MDHGWMRRQVGMNRGKHGSGAELSAVLSSKRETNAMLFSCTNSGPKLEKAGKHRISKI